MTPVPEFSRPRRLDQIGETVQPLAIDATAEERAALAERFGLIEIGALTADLRLSRKDAAVLVTGTVRGAVVQRCVATGDPVPATIEESVDLRFVPEPADPNEELEIDSDEADTVFYTGGAVDLGEAAAETLALALDPYPRSVRADSALREAGVVSEAEAGPFGALAGLRDKLSRGD